MKISVGVLAHVDAGKTTFSEQVLYMTGALRSLGRVDHGDAFLDSDTIEKRRGITIFSDQARFTHNGNTYYWLDTPGHVDFSPEMERAISAMDYAILIISCVEGVQSHTRTVWELLKKHEVPVFVFINKTDRSGADKERVLGEIKRNLSSDAVFADGYDAKNIPENLIEAIAERDEKALDMLLGGESDHAYFRKVFIEQIKERGIFPVFTGSALNDIGVNEFMNAFFNLAKTDYEKYEKEPFACEIYKIRHDNRGARVTFFKVLSGKIGVRDELPCGRITELRVYSGQKYDSVQTAQAGDLCAAVGLTQVGSGTFIKDGKMIFNPFTCEPMLESTVELPEGVRTDDALRVLKEIEEEEPTLSVRYENGNISVRVMGEIQLEVLLETIERRYGMRLTFGKRRVLFMETVSEPVIGIGHYEPLRHYAEVHLRLVPMPRGSGISFESKCHVDKLTLNWQRLIETHVFETVHKGVLIGAPLTDVKVQLLAGRDHLKHTEGGDFREATYRAIRCALMNAQSVILEPVCRFNMSVPGDMYGRVAGDLLKMRADCGSPEYSGDSVIINGTVTFREISDYITELAAVTHGRGTLTYSLDHYAPVPDAEKLIEEADYNPYTGQSPDSVFCAKGAGYTVNWKDVPSTAHIEQVYDI